MYAHIYAYSGICGEVRDQLARIGSLFLSCRFQRLKLGPEGPDSWAGLTSPISVRRPTGGQRTGGPLLSRVRKGLTKQGNNT